MNKFALLLLLLLMTSIAAQPYDAVSTSKRMLERIMAACSDCLLISFFP